MGSKPTYEELEQRVKGLERASVKRKQVEMALRHSEEKYRELVESANSIILKMDTQGNITLFNEFAQSFFGYKKEEIIGRNVIGTIVPSENSAGRDLAAMIEDIGRYPERYKNNENENMRKDGERVWVAWTNKPVVDEKGRVTEILCVGNDITVRKQSEDALREDEERYRKLVRLSPDPIVIIQDGRHILFSSAFTELFGYTQQDVDNGLSVLDVMHQDYKEAVRVRLKDRFSGKAVPRRLRVDMIAKSGRIIPCESSGVLIQYGGRPAILVIIRDITERKKIEEKMIIFQKFAEASEQGLGMADLNGNITYVNPALCRQLGERTPEEAIGKNGSLYYSEEHLKKLENESFPTVMKQGHWTGELDLISRDGKITNAIQSIFLIRDKTEKPFCMANVITDITEHKQLDKILIHREKLKTLGAIAGEVAHEIRNPLVSIGGFAKRLKQKYPDSNECNIILNETQRLENILSRIRNYLEPVEIHPRQCSINAIITSAVHLLSPETESRQVTCVLDLFKELSSGYADPGILSQIFINLIRNGTEATEKGGDLFIKTFESDQTLQVEFKNKATGLKLKDPELYFMPFAEGGRSIGLPLCHRLLKDMGGILSFVQDQEFMVFTVSLPKKVQADQAGN
ncbi:MAG: PAS domain S-box protein [Deltaproteobacteria bacterium]|nr:PAS domain S-box protein [Deltaproteobacteria bacterium]